MNLTGKIRSINSGTTSLTTEGQLYNALDDQVELDSSGFNAPSVVDQNVRTNVNVNQNAVEDDFDNPVIKLREIKLKNPINPSLAYNIVNSIRNKHSDLFTFLDCNIDILTIAETKLDCTFPTAQYIVEGYNEPFRKDRNKNGGGLLVMSRRIYPQKWWRRTTCICQGGYTLKNGGGLLVYVKEDIPSKMVEDCLYMSTRIYPLMNLKIILQCQIYLI